MQTNGLFWMRINVFIQIRLISNEKLTEHKSGNCLLMKATKNNRKVCCVSAHFVGCVEMKSFCLLTACNCDSHWLCLDIFFQQWDMCYLGCQLKWEDSWNAKPFPACSIVKLSLVARLLCGFLQVICQARQATYYFLPFDCPLCPGATLLQCHVIGLILLTSSGI